METLVEHPQLIYDINIDDLEHLHSNKKMYRKLAVHDKNKELIYNYNQNSAYPIYYSNQYGRNRIYCLNSELKTVEYYMEYEIQSCGFITQDWVTQIMVWRNGSKLFSGMTDDVIFELLLPNSHIIMSDSQQTLGGKSLWMRLIRYAFGRNLNVYFVDFHEGTTTLIKSLQQFQSLDKELKPWQDAEFGKGYRFAIADVKL